MGIKTPVDGRRLLHSQEIVVEQGVSARHSQIVQNSADRFKLQKPRTESFLVGHELC